MKTITVLAAVSQEQLENNGCDVEQECETIAEAKKRATRSGAVRRGNKT